MYRYFAKPPKQETGMVFINCAPAKKIMGKLGDTCQENEDIRLNF